MARTKAGSKKLPKPANTPLTRRRPHLIPPPGSTHPPLTPPAPIVSQRSSRLVTFENTSTFQVSENVSSSIPLLSPTTSDISTFSVKNAPLPESSSEGSTNSLVGAGETIEDSIFRKPSSTPVSAERTREIVSKASSKQNRTEETGAETPVKKRSYRFRPGTKSLQEIRKYQKSHKLLIPCLSFSRLVREIASKMAAGFRFQSLALLALQEASEAFITSLMEDSLIFALHARRVTLLQKDLVLARRIRGC